MRRLSPVGTVDVAAVAVNGVSKRYGSALALDDVSFSVPAGSALALWGPNGAGKTTILRCLLGLARYRGEIHIFGHDAGRDGRSARARLGYVPQELPISPLTVGETADFIATLKRSTATEARARLEQLGIGDQTSKTVAALSGGMKQRLALALALIGSPDLLLLDEPTANLDARGRAELLDLLKTLRRDGLTLVFSSHQPEDVVALADRVLMIERGQVVKLATPAEFRIELGQCQRLTVTLKNGHLPVAIEALRDLGLDPITSGKVLTMPVSVGQKASVLARLARDGVEIDDFDVERVGWTES